MADICNRETILLRYAHFLSGIRAAMLYRQLGGGRLALLFQRSRVFKELESIGYRNNMNLSTLTAISPIDGRYASKVDALRPIAENLA